MLTVKANINSVVEDILSFKTCCGVRAYDQNLELLVTNQSDQPVEVPSHCDLETASGPHRIRNLMPPGDQPIQPRETIAFYCTMDEELWKQVRRITFYDTQGHSYPTDLAPAGSED